VVVYEGCESHAQVAGGCEQDLWLAVLLQIMLKKMQAVPTAVFSRSEISNLIDL
jgi:hypothetical protein